jgi:hypothetical protein
MVDREGARRRETCPRPCKPRSLVVLFHFVVRDNNGVFIKRALHDDRLGVTLQQIEENFALPDGES